jgi:HEAT repeat protein
LLDLGRQVSVASLYRLSDLGMADVSRLASAWPAMAAQRRRQIMRMLVDISESNFEVDFVPVARMALADEDAEVRIAAIEGLWESEDAELVPHLLQLLTSDPDRSVRAAAAAGLAPFILLEELGKLRPLSETRAEEALIAAVDTTDEDLDVRRRAVESLGYSGHERVPEIIERAYYDDNEKMRASAVFAMGRSADARWLPRVLDELASASPEMRYEAARAAGELEARQAVPALVEMIEDPDREVQEAAIWALGEIGGSQAQSALEAILEEGDDLLHDAAEEALDTLTMMHGIVEFPLFAFEDNDEDDAV